MSEVNNTPSSIDDGIPEVSFQVEVAETVQAPIDPTLSIEGMAADAKATGDAIQAAQETLQAEIDAIETGVDSVAGRLFPVGCVYISLSSTAPTFGGTSWTWQEITMPATWGDIEDGMRSYVDGTGTGNIHFWRRTA